jgi:hypothetical protein
MQYRIFSDLARANERTRLQAVDLVQMLKRELGERVAQSLHIDNDTGRWAWKFCGSTYTASTVSEATVLAVKLRAGDRKPTPKQEGFVLPMVRGGER